MEVQPDRIADVFKGREILLTGGTGFLGKVIVEKFLRCIPGIKHIYLLIRPKKGKDPKHRLDEMFNSPVSISKTHSSTKYLQEPSISSSEHFPRKRYSHFPKYEIQNLQRSTDLLLCFSTCKCTFSFKISTFAFLPNFDGSFCFSSRAIGEYLFLTLGLKKPHIFKRPSDGN